MANDGVFIGKGETPQFLPLKYANRHGLIAGATGTGKTVTLQILAEGFSKAGVPVFAADVKGDLSGLAAPGSVQDFLVERAAKVGLSDYGPAAFPTVFWDLYGVFGHPVRTTVSEMGPLLLGRLLDLNQTQEGVLALAFRVADDEKLLLVDLKDLRALLADVASRTDDLAVKYGHVARSTIGAIQRQLLAFEQEGADKFFGEPALDMADFIRTDSSGAGVINILMANRLMEAPKLYATFLLWLLSELFEELPEVGDAEKPKLVFFFDEAHLLFTDAPKALIEKIEQVVRLIRSKGVGVFFVTQNPKDIPDSVSNQLGARIQHALRAFTASEQKVIKAAAQMFRANPGFSTLEAITDLGVGEALVSTLQEKGAPSMVDRTLVRPPASRMGPITQEERAEIIRRSGLGAKYDQRIDRDSAYERLAERTKRERRKTQRRSPRGSSSRRQSVGEAAIKSAARALSSLVTRELVRGLLGGLKRDR